MNDVTEVLKGILTRTKAEVGKVIIGQKKVIDRALIAILTSNHALIEGVPGIAKTLLVKTLAHVLGCEFSRIQFTPDLMPSDITGTNVFNLKKNAFSLVKGPIFTTFLLADEINRAPAKTQSALLQAMQERCVTIDRTTYPLSSHFTVFATQNPIEYQGTYPLPEAQKDRFMLKVRMAPPDRESELTLAKRMLEDKNTPETMLRENKVKPVLTAEKLVKVKHAVETITIREDLIGYIIDIIRKTRKHPQVLVGAGPRATQSLLLSARVHAIIDGRDFVTPDDIKEMTASVLEHRLILRPEFEVEGLRVNEVIDNLLKEIAIPR